MKKLYWGASLLSLVLSTEALAKDVYVRDISVQGLNRVENETVLASGLNSPDHHQHLGRVVRANFRMERGSRRDRTGRWRRIKLVCADIYPQVCQRGQQAPAYHRAARQPAQP